MGDPSSEEGCTGGAAKKRSGVASVAAPMAPERMKSRREKEFFLDMRCPALLIFPRPHLHGFRVALDSPVVRVQVQFPLNLPRDVRKLQHRNRNGADGNRSVELLAFADSRNKGG